MTHRPDPRTRRGRPGRRPVRRLGGLLAALLLVAATRGASLAAEPETAPAGGGGAPEPAPLVAPALITDEELDDASERQSPSPEIATTAASSPTAAPAPGNGTAPTPAVPARTFYFPTRGIKDVTITFESEAPLETILGVTNRAHGKFSFDPATGSGAIEVAVDAASLRTGIDLRDEHLRGERWLATAAHPEITFRSSDVRPVAGAPDTYRCVGAVTIRGITHEVAAEVNARLIPQGDEVEAAGFGRGDVAHVRTAFVLALSDYGINVPVAEALKVANSVTIRLNLFASTDPGRYRLVEEERQAAAAAGGPGTPAGTSPQAP